METKRSNFARNMMDRSYSLKAKYENKLQFWD